MLLNTIIKTKFEGYKMQFHEHIGIFNNALSNELCDNLINLFENAASAGLSKSRKQHEGFDKIYKDDYHVFFGDLFEVDLKMYPLSLAFLDCFWKNAYYYYAEKYDILKTLGEHTIYDVKLQKTIPGGGYHIWHCEQGSRHISNRIMAFTAYLNTVDEGGETEFLYQSKRVKAEKGTIVLFPASYTHTHRGNPPLSNEKYIATGWIEF